LEKAGNYQGPARKAGGMSFALPENSQIEKKLLSNANLVK